ncbi:serine/threonine dehydratase [Streptomyces boncukensis]|uniref:Pyridoxal-phosphate dependent enzyme n=1 Tax=Streptomyces boncukensis TaxID=2711219 RepID=A0A6G4WWK5_9ACTN|nr:serine/threonine dehydratase [Streptomyces boncukensis]NGO69669.1 pyridoxal-phosphate dependent enzyme [Streptomyces boncukensis]
MVSTTELGPADIDAAADRVRGRVRPVLVSRASGASRFSRGDAGPDGAPPFRADGGGEVWLALEFLQHTGSFKARGALNFLHAHRAAGTLTRAGVTLASGGNAGLAGAWAAAALGVPASVFLPASAPAVKVTRLKGYGADVHLVDGEYAHAAAACADFADRTGALRAHAYDDPYIAAGAGTLLDEILDRVPGLDTVLVAVGGGGLFAGVATAAHRRGVRTVAVEPANCPTLHAALEAGRPVDVPVSGVAADALGARRATPLALSAARRADTRSVLVPDRAVDAARRTLWDEWRLVTEHGGATALACLLDDGSGRSAYAPAPGERTAVVLCGANTDPSDLVRPGAARDAT